MFASGLNKNIIIVGGNAAGPAAAAKAKRTAPDVNVIMFEAGGFISTGTCELPYVLSGEIKNFEDIIFFTAQSFEQEKGVKVFTSHFVEKIDRKKKFISVKNLKSGEKFEQPFDKLILCTGSVSKRIPELPKELSNVFLLKSVADFISIKNYLSANTIRKVLIVGGGYIGLEAAEAFTNLGIEVTILDKEKLPMPGAEIETRGLILELLKQNKVEFIGEADDVKYKHDGKKFISIKYEGRIIEYDLVLVSIGFEPNNNLAVSSKLAVGKFGGISVNQKLLTSDPNIYAAGDCIEVINRITSRADYLPLATIAQQTGHTAGENAAGGNTVINPFVKNVAVKIFDKCLAIIGLTSSELMNNFYHFSEVHTVLPNLVKVMPDSENVFGKIMYDKRTKLILGANFFGSKEVSGYADLISSFITNKIKATELANINYNYTPPVSPFINILSVLGRKITGTK